MTSQTDLTGREHITWSVLTSWAGHVVYIAVGFILPRMIDERLGQDRLGVWDFAWSCVAYFSLVQGGVVSSINRYVARHRAAGDLAGVNRVVSSVSCVLWCMAGIVVLLAIVTALLIPVFWGRRLGEFVGDAQWAVFLLGLGIAVEVGSAGFAGVLTGCHRWDLHNGVHAFTCVLTTTGMITAVLVGGGLPALAAAHVLGETVGRLLRVGLAYRECPSLHVRLKLADWPTAREMLHFGSKSFIPSLGDLLLNQTVSVLVLSSLGPAALAVFSRPRALVRYVDALVSKLAFVLAPTASSLQATDQQDELRDLLVRAARYGAYLALPMILTLTLLGDPILRVWMGPHYALGQVLLILALGSLPAIAQQPVLYLLCGLNAHGRPGLASLAASLVAVGLTLVAMGPLDWGLTGVALAVCIPQAVTSGLYVPALACRRLRLPFAYYLLQVWRRPILYCTPFALCLALARLALNSEMWSVAAAALVTGGLFLAVIYYRNVVPSSLKALIASLLSRRLVKPAESAA